MASQRHGSAYRPELDVVRFLAFLFVFLHHELPRSPHLERTGGISCIFGDQGWRLLTSLANACGMGLCLFFTLSAYLITNLLLQERECNGTISVKKFYFRRVLRIWPLYLQGISIGIVWALIHHQSSQTTSFIWYLLMAGNIYCATHGWIDNPMTPLWSISIEEQFYLVWPWAMRWLSRRCLQICALFFILVANTTLFLMGQKHADVEFAVWANTFVQFEMFAVGILLALLKKPKVRGWVSIAPGLILIGPALWFVACYFFHVKHPSAEGGAISGMALMLGYGLIALGCACVLHGFCIMGPAPMPKWAASLGKISYGLYVYHLLIIKNTKFVYEYFFHPRSIVTILLALGLTILVAKLSYAFFERPFMMYKKRFEIIHAKEI